MVCSNRFGEVVERRWPTSDRPLKCLERFPDEGKVARGKQLILWCHRAPSEMSRVFACCRWLEWVCWIDRWRTSALWEALLVRKDVQGGLERFLPSSVQNWVTRDGSQGMCPRPAHFDGTFDRDQCLRPKRVGLAIPGMPTLVTSIDDGGAVAWRESPYAGWSRLTF